MATLGGLKILEKYCKGSTISTILFSFSKVVDIKYICKAFPVFRKLVFFQNYSGWRFLLRPNIKLNINSNKKSINSLTLNPCLVNPLIFYRLKTAENLWFCKVFRGNKMRKLARNGLKTHPPDDST